MQDLSDLTNSAVRRMIEHSLSICDDPLYRDVLYRWLLGDDVDSLINLTPSPYLEDFLKDSEPDILYR